MRSAPIKHVAGFDREPVGRSFIEFNSTIEHATVGNRLLRGLDSFEFQQLAPRLQRVALRPRQVLVERNVPVHEVFFIERGLASVISRTRQDSGVEVSMIGRMSVTGLAAVLGTVTSPFRCMVHTAGMALRISTPDLRQAMDELPHLRQRLMNFVRARMVQQAQITVCNSCHRLSARVARWLLLGLDRYDHPQLPVTHELLGRMLGVRRASISTVLKEFERRAVVRRGRGSLTILDRNSLEKCACDCYRLIRREYERLICDPQ